MLPRPLEAAALVAMVAAAALPACDDAGDDGPTRPADDDSGDDDSAAPGDDNQPSGIAAVTFAAAMEGTDVGPDPGGDSSITGLSGIFQFVYWNSLEEQDLACRQRYSFEATASFGGGTVQPCDACAGRLDVTAVQPLDPSDFPDGCPGLPGDVDLSFLLAPDDVAVPADFRTLALLDVDLLLGAGWEIGQPGLGVDDLVAHYGSAGLEVLHVGFVSSSGWLDEEAGLGEVATAWLDAGWLPMFVVYAEAGTQPDGPVLVGETFMSTLWTVRVGSASGVEELP